MKIKSEEGSLFYTSLKKKVDSYFSEKGIKKTGNGTLYIQTFTVIILAFFFYLYPFFVPMTLITYLSFRIASGAITGTGGFVVGHDGAHGSYSEKEWVNNLAAKIFDFSGVSNHNWKTKHNIIHHGYTNTPEDDDVDTNGALRLGPWQKWHFVYIFQPIYAFLLYGSLHLIWYFKDFVRYSTGMIGECKITTMSKSEKIFFWFAKILYIFKSLIIPIIFFGFYKGVIGFLVMEFTCGLLISIVFQLAHVQNKVMFYIGNPNINIEWAVFQMRTTADFATWNPIFFHLFGGLNFQREHHLFPKISHVHYRQVHKILADHCKEYGVPQNTYRTMTGAVLDHIWYLCKMAFTKNLKPSIA